MIIIDPTSKGFFFHREFVAMLYFHSLEMHTAAFHNAFSSELG